MYSLLQLRVAIMGRGIVSLSHAELIRLDLYDYLQVSKGLTLGWSEDPLSFPYGISTSNYPRLSKSLGLTIEVEGPVWIGRHIYRFNRVYSAEGTSAVTYLTEPSILDKIFELHGVG